MILGQPKGPGNKHVKHCQATNAKHNKIIVTWNPPVAVSMLGGILTVRAHLRWPRNTYSCRSSLGQEALKFKQHVNVQQCNENISCFKSKNLHVASPVAVKRNHGALSSIQTDATRTILHLGPCLARWAIHPHRAHWRRAKRWEPRRSAQRATCSGDVDRRDRRVAVGAAGGGWSGWSGGRRMVKVGRPKRSVVESEVL